MIDMKKLVPGDLEQKDILDVRLNNRWYTDAQDKRRKARWLVVQYHSLAEVRVPMIWSTETKTWTEDKDASRVTFGPFMQ